MKSAFLNFQKILNKETFLHISERLQSISGILAIVLFYSVLHLLNIGCPIKYITGISCAGCGMTRAWLCVLRLDFSGAYYFHPLYWLVPFPVMLYLIRNKLTRKVIHFFEGSFTVIFITVYIIRMMNPEDTVVRINFYESAIWHILERVRVML